MIGSIGTKYGCIYIIIYGDSCAKPGAPNDVYANFRFQVSQTTRTLVVPFGGARDATALQLQERQRKVWERPVGKKPGAAVQNRGH